jgi:hypothetical protein
MYLWRTQSGLVPTLVKALTAHAALAQQSTNATTTHNALLHLQRCRSDFNTLSSLVQVGRLPEAVEASEGLNALLDEAPMPLSQADVIYDMKVGICTVCYTCHAKWSTAKISCFERPDRGAVGRCVYTKHFRHCFRNQNSVICPMYVLSICSS